MTDAATTAARPTGRDTVPRRFWVGLVAVAMYVLIAGVGANLLLELVSPSDELVDFTLGHFISVPVLIIAGLVFVRRSGWSRDVWRAPASWETRPRRWWLLAIPALMLIQSLVQLGTAPWGDQGLGAIVVVAVGLALVGIGEELYFRGILRVSVRAHHGEFLTLLVTASLFGLAHSFGSLMQGIPLGTIAFQVSVTAFTGVSLYAAFRATGRLWVPMALHALDDFSIYLHSGEPSSVQAPGTPVTVTVQLLLGVLAVVLVVSTIREDAHARKAARTGATASAGAQLQPGEHGR